MHFSPGLTKSCSPAKTYNMSVADFNLGPFGIDSRTNESTCLGAFFDLAFSGDSRISWVVSPGFLLLGCSLLVAPDCED